MSLLFIVYRIVIINNYSLVTQCPTNIELMSNYSVDEVSTSSKQK